MADPTDPIYKYSVNEYPTDGVKTEFEISFAGGYLSRDYVKVKFTDSTGNIRYPEFAFIGDFQISVSPALEAGGTLMIYRDTPVDQPIVDFQDGAIINEASLDINAKQAVHLAAEARDVVGSIPELDALTSASAALAFARSRANHTGVQGMDTVTGLPELAAANSTYPSASAGIAATAAGLEFTVSNADGTATVYLNEGGVAVEQRKIATVPALSSWNGVPILGVPIIYARQAGAKGDGATDDWAVLQGLNNALEARGGGIICYEAGVYALSKPLEIGSFVTHRGDTCGGDIANVLKGVWFKQLTDAPDSGGKICVASSRAKRQFSIENIGFLGRSTGTSAPVGHVGLYLKSASNFTVSHTRVDRVRGVGHEFETCYIGDIRRPTSMRCQDYGFYFHNGCTSLTVVSPLAWGTAGGYRLSAVTYSTIISPACDYSDNPAESFVGQGGQATPRACIWRLSAVQGVTIVSAGCEGALSRWLYAEGAQVTFLAPNLANMNANEAGWTFAEIRGTGYSNIRIDTPYGLHGIINTLSSNRAFFVEMPEVQKFYITGRWRLNNFATATSYTNDGIVVVGEKTVLNLTQQTMIAGTNTTPFIKADPTDVAEVVVESGVKKLLIDAVAGDTQKFTVPIGIRRGFFLAQIVGEFTSGYSTAKIQLIGDDSTVYKTWSSSGTAISHNERAWVDTTVGGTVAGSPLNLVITTNHKTDVMKLSKLVLTYAEGQV